MTAYLVARGVPASAIVGEHVSTNTMQSIANTAALLDVMGASRVHFVTSRYHMRRVSHLARDARLEHTISGTSGGTVTWSVAREIGATIYCDLFHYRESMCLTVIAWLAILACMLKLVDMAWLNARWCIRSGDKYVESLSQGPFSPARFEALNQEMARGHLRITSAIQRLPRVGRILSIAYHFPVLYGCSAALLLVMSSRPGAAAGPAALSWNAAVAVLTLVCILSIAVVLVTRFANRLFLGPYADLDDSLFPGRAPGIRRNKKMMVRPSFRRPILLFFFDILVFTLSCAAVFSAIEYLCVDPDFAGASTHGIARAVDFVYFATISTTTSGHGDIVPLSSVARIAVATQVLLAVAHFVGLVMTFSFTTRTISAPPRAAEPASPPPQSVT